VLVLCSCLSSARCSTTPAALQLVRFRCWLYCLLHGLPCGKPGMGEVMEGAMQQAAQPGRHCMGGECAAHREKKGPA
jgi:hypothetical protein